MTMMPDAIQRAKVSADNGWAALLRRRDHTLQCGKMPAPTVSMLVSAPTAASVKVRLKQSLDLCSSNIIT